MKTKLFVTTAAAALLAAATFASAQQGGGGQGSGAAGGAAGASQSGGASGGAAGGMGAGGAGGAGTSTMDRGSTTTQDRVQDDRTAPNQRTGQSPTRTDQNQAQTPRQGDRPGQAQQQNGQGRQGARENTGAASSNVNVTGEQRTQIRQRLGANTSARIDRSSVNFSLSVGVRVPNTVRLYDLPPAIVEIVPAYRGYKYVIVEEEIVIIDPRTHTIITVIES